MFNGFSFRSRSVVPAPLVARESKTSASFLGINLLNNPVEECEQLASYEKSQDVSKNSEGEYVVAVQLRSFLAKYQNRINVAFYGTRFIHHFIPYHILDSKLDQESNRHLLELRLAKCIVCLQLLADPNLPAHDMPNQPTIYLLSSFFAKNRFSQNNLNLLFSYGLSYHSYREAFKVYIKNTIYKHYADDTAKEIEIELGQSWKQLESCLSDCASNEEKDIFAKKYKVCREALEVIEKDNSYIQCYKYLKQAYEFYIQNHYIKAAHYYHAAEKLLTGFQLDKTLSPLILQDYAMRMTKCAAYHNACQNLAEKKCTHPSSIQQLVSQCFSWNRQEKNLRLSDETDSTSSNEDVEPLIPFNKLKYT